MTEDIFDLKPKSGERQVSCYFRKQTGPESKEGSTGVCLRCKGEAKAVTKLIQILNEAIPRDEEQ